MRCIHYCKNRPCKMDLSRHVINSHRPSGDWQYEPQRAEATTEEPLAPRYSNDTTDGRIVGIGEDASLDA